MANAFLDEIKQTIKVNEIPLQPKEVVIGVVHPVTKETITKSNQLIDNPIMRDMWSKLCTRSWDIVSKHMVRKTPYITPSGTAIMRFLDLEGNSEIPRNRVVTYVIIVVDYQASKQDPNQVKMTVRGTSSKICTLENQQHTLLTLPYPN
jgi:hypothetical protein